MGKGKDKGADGSQNPSSLRSSMTRFKKRAAGSSRADAPASDVKKEAGQPAELNSEDKTPFSLAKRSASLPVSTVGSSNLRSRPSSRGSGRAGEHHTQVTVSVADGRHLNEMAPFVDGGAGAAGEQGTAAHSDFASADFPLSHSPPTVSPLEVALESRVGVIQTAPMACVLAVVPVLAAVAPKSDLTPPSSPSKRNAKRGASSVSSSSSSEDAVRNGLVLSAHEASAVLAKGQPSSFMLEHMSPLWPSEEFTLSVGEEESSRGVPCLVALLTAHAKPVAAAVIDLAGCAAGKHEMWLDMATADSEGTFSVPTATSLRLLFNVSHADKFDSRSRAVRARSPAGARVALDEPLGMVSMSPKVRQKVNSMVAEHTDSTEADPATDVASLSRVVAPEDISNELINLLENSKGRSLIKDIMRRNARRDQRNAEFARKYNLPAGESVHKSWSSAVRKQILVHGRLFLTDSFIIFHSNIFGVKTNEKLNLRDIVEVKKWRRGLQLGIDFLGSSSDPTARLSVTSFFNRDKAFRTLHSYWEAFVQDPDRSRRYFERANSTRQLRLLAHDADSTYELEGGGDEDESDESDDDLDDALGELLDEDARLDSSVIVSDQATPSEKFLLAKTDKFEVMVDETIGNCSSVAKFFNMFWADGQFYTKYHKSRDDDHIEVSEWKSFHASSSASASPSPAASMDQNGMHENLAKSESPTFREAQFVSPYDPPFFAKKASNTARCEETQRYHLTKTSLTVEARQYMLDIPFGDYFSVESRWIVQEISEGLHVKGMVGVHFSKSTIFRSKIASEVTKQTAESFQKWLALAREDLAAADDAKLVPAPALAPSPVIVSTATVVETTPTPHPPARKRRPAKSDNGSIVSTVSSSSSWEEAKATISSHIFSPVTVAIGLILATAAYGAVSFDSAILALSIGFVLLLEKRVAGLQAEVEGLRSSHAVSVAQLDTLQKQLAAVQQQQRGPGRPPSRKEKRDKSSSKSDSRA